jgi:hypothetical protein
VTLERLLAAQPNQRLPLESALYVAAEVSRLVAGEHELNHGVGPALAGIAITADGGVVLGSPRHGLDLAGDVLQVGKLVYKLLTGKEPTNDVVAPSHFNPGVDEELDAVVLASLAPNPNRRPQSVRVLEGALSAVFEELDLEPDPHSLGKLAKQLPMTVTPPPQPKVTPKPKAVVSPLPQPPQPQLVKAQPPKYRPPVRFQDAEDEVMSEAVSMPNEVPIWVHMQNVQAWLEPRRKVVGGITAAVVVLLMFIAWPSSKKHVVVDEADAAPVETVKKAPSKQYQLVPEALLTTVNTGSKGPVIKKTVVASRKK